MKPSDSNPEMGPDYVAARLAAIVESSDDAIVSKRLDGTILTWNAAAERLFGFSSDEMLGQSIYKIIPEELHTEERGLLDMVAQGERVERYETIRRRKDGALVPIALSMAPVRDASGQIVGASSIKHDVSERRRSLELQSRAAAIIESSDDAILSKTVDGRITSWNAAAERIFGYRPEEIIGKSIFTLIPPHLHAEEEAILNRIAKGEHVAHYETERLRKDGKVITISLTMSPVRDGSGNVVGVSSIKRDITNQRMAEQALRQASKMEAIGRLAGGLAHDFNNQLHALSGFAHFIGRDPTLSASSRQDLLQIQKAADRMASMTRQLLAFARQQVLAPEVLELDETVAEALPLLQRLLGSNVEIQVISAPGPKWIRVDRAQLIQVLMNLGINARDAMPGGGAVRISMDSVELGPHHEMDRTGTWIQPGAYGRLRVQDSGQGIAPEHLGRIFEPFFTTKDVGQGTGLGLATVDGIVSQSGGYLNVDSQPGHGTTFSIYLPLTAAPSRPTPAPQAAVTRPAGRQRRILLVDDDPHVRTVIARLLRSEGYDVAEAENGREGLEAMAQAGGGVDLVITDLVMPVMGGREFVAQLGRDYPGASVIWISGHARESEFPEPSTAMGHPFLQKPVPADILLETVRGAIERAQAAR